MRLTTSALCLAVLALSLSARPAEAAKVTVPINVGIGPTVNWFTGPVANDNPVHFGVELRLQAVIDQATIKKNKKRIPKKYKKMASKVTEVRITPSIFIPESIFLSPPILSGTGIYGATWKFVSLGVPLVNTDAVKLRLSAGVIASIFFLHSSTLLDGNGDTVGALLFIRPGIDPSIELEIKITQSFLISFAWQSNVYVPQVVDADFGTSFLSLPGDQNALKQSIFHVGQAWIMFHFRFPRTMNI